PEAVGEPEKEEDEAADEPVDTPPDADAGDRLDLNRATFEELRDVGFSVTQATRVITYRERQHGFSSIDDLAEVPGMPGTFLQEVRGRLTV
ncbi:MAG: ComEA family DNA-binding protein, partial [Solirubrobacterales bacterium]